ncbi:ImmA/IrrE family metallo-endopeptidase [Bradyrhizobium sp. Bra64]|uniref:ImmA/IrrE family metallo-endopeptidase n=1 Tax=Bradyrhizobium sp. Bra64 TaxID=2926009 RepID=UPI002117924B|nr:ImmA/IrrE family metallo-endopeptidase [Bradyrhizobium sp. Bra64]
MPKKVPYLDEQRIERDAAALLAEFQQARGVVITRQVPIEDIVEKHLKLGIEFDDMHRLLNHPRLGPGRDPDILGAMFFDERRIVIDESLDPEENPSMEGRYRFTLAHEGGGHWRLHRHLFVRDPEQVSFFNEPATPSIVCRSSQAKAPIEWQADFYASCLLMPRKFVMAAWDEMFPDRKPRVLQPRTPINHPFVEVPRFDCQIGDHDCSETDDNVLYRIARPLAEQFLVSPIAMRIRLEKLGLLHRTVPLQRLLSDGS